MTNAVLSAIDGKAPQLCLDELYAAIYVSSRQSFINEFPVHAGLDSMRRRHEIVLKRLGDEFGD